MDAIDPRRTLQKVWELQQRVSTGAPQVDPHSSLGADDRAVSPHHLSHAVWFAITNAVDHLEAVRALIEDAGRTQPWAHWALIRAALENAATAAWLLAPASRDERVSRALRLAKDNIEQSRAAARLHGLTPPSGRTHEGRLQTVSDLAAARGITLPKNRLSYTEIVDGAAANTAFKPEILVLSWRVCSGLTHGRMWASIGLLEREEYESPAEGVMDVKLTTSLNQIMPFVETVLAVLNVALASYERGRVVHTVTT
ncbi:hypothetical protein [Georgenia yuyongxinii]|uniref:Uncharacterized protein n=1 Tax=Georgenia yuyongxinii TaxID=2589797 RepID=A0A552WUG0_9MICO|nr:hypothetical protein [Georgenia yuyongxinii]TRW46387.1 hypothetical protein FJ693_05525 [Georgenia yuyongxinii]